jgi:uncharacterized membrane protein
MKRLLITFALLALTAGSVLAEEVVTFEMLDSPVPNTWIDAATSFDGSRIVGNFGGSLWMYENGAWTYVGEGHPLSSAIGMSADGTAFINAADGEDGIRYPAIWREADGWTPSLLPGIPGYDSCDNSVGSGYGLNQDGSIAVGLGWNACEGTAFMWTPGGGTQDIGPVRASEISADGSVIVGFEHHLTYGYRQPVYWRNEGGVVTGPFPIGLEDCLGEAFDVSFDGSVICGEYNDGTWATSQAFTYTEADGITLLGTVEGLENHASSATAMSEDGKIVGMSGEGGPWGFQQAFIKFADQPMQYLWAYLQSIGAVIPDGVYPIYVVDLSGDGSLLVGVWQDDFWNQGMFLVRFQDDVANEDIDETPGQTLPTAFNLAPNLPNPFNPQTSIAFALPRGEQVRLDIFDAAGRLVRTLVDENRAAGEHTVIWDGTDDGGNGVASGTYVYKLQTDTFVRARSMTLLK